MESLSAKIENFCINQSSKFDFYRVGLIVLLGMLAYSNTLFSPFIFDDAANLFDNPQIMDLSGAGLKAAFHSRRAIGIITFQLNYFFFGWNVVGFHVTNIIIHIFTAISVYRLLQLIMVTEYMADNADDRFRTLPIPFFSALLFIAHPVQTQAVTYIVQRFASLAALFYLVSLITYLSGRIKQLAAHKVFNAQTVAWYCASFIFGVLAFFTKETAYTLPVAIMLVELVFFRANLKKIVLILVTSIGIVFAALMKYASTSQSLQNAISVLDEATRLQTTTTRLDYLLTQFRVIMTYMRLFFFPIDQRLDYDFALSHSFLDWRVFCSFLTILTLLLVSGWLLKISQHGLPHLRLIAFGVVWFFLTLSIESSIIPIIDLIFEHRLYLPLFGAVTAVVSAVTFFAWGRGAPSGKVVCVGFLVLSLLLAAAAFKRNSIWESEISIWSDAVEKSPASARAWNNLGAVNIKQREPLNALRAIIRSIELDPSKADAWNNLGIALDIMGSYHNRFTRTSEMFRSPESFKGKVVNQWLGDVNNNLGLAYEITGNLQKAAESYSSAVGYNPSLGLAYYNLGIVSAKLGDASKYSAQVQILRMIDPLLAERLQITIEQR